MTNDSSKSGHEKKDSHEHSHSHSHSSDKEHKEHKHHHSHSHSSDKDHKEHKHSHSHDKEHKHEHHHSHSHSHDKDKDHKHKHHHHHSHSHSGGKHPKSSNMLLAGCYTEDFPWAVGHGKGISVFSFSEDEGSNARLELKSVCDAGPNPSYMCLHDDGDIVIAANEHNADGDTGKGALTVLKVHRKKHELEHLYRGRSEGKGTVHVSMIDVVEKKEEDEPRVAVANYDDGTVSSFRLEGKHNAKEMKIVKEGGAEHKDGSNVHTMRQDGPHTHCVVPHPKDRSVVFVCDLGQDVIYGYRATEHQWTILSKTYLAPGSGPRHLVFSSTGQTAFVMCELSVSIATLRCDLASGSMQVMTVEPLLDAVPADGSCTGAAIRLSPNKNFVFASTRCPANIVVFKIHREHHEDLLETDHTKEKDYNLTKVHTAPTLGTVARDFVLHPSGKYLVAANAVSDTLVLFAVCPDSGELTQLQVIDTPSPQAVLFV